MQREALLD